MKMKPLVRLESLDESSNLTREIRLVPLGCFLFIDDKYLFSVDPISSDDISHVVDFRN